MLRPGEPAVAYLVAVAGDGAADLLADVRVGLHEARPEVLEQPEHVVRDEDLAVAPRAGPDADRRDREAPRDLFRDRRGNALHHDREGPGLFDGAGVVQQRRLVALHAEAAELADRLRRQADVAHDGDLR